jgi:alanine racemase
MTGYTLVEIAQILNVPIIGSDQGIVTEYSIDTRNIGLPNRTLFFAITTELGDGHDHVRLAAEKGLICAVVQHEISGAVCAQLVVKDVVVALQLLAKHHRQRFDIPVVGITGSNGKTMVKEWMNQLCSAHFNICRSPRSYNSQLGVALSLLQINEQHQMAIIEAGISMPNEMGSLQEMIQPTLGVFTHLGHAHLSNFPNQGALRTEKMKLFQNTIPVISPEMEPLSEMSLQWGQGAACEWKVKWIQSASLRQADVEWKGQNFTVTFPFISDIETGNAMTALVTALHLGVPVDHAVAGVGSLSALDMRMEQLEGIDESVLINDAYSFDVSSLKLAMQDVWRLQKDHPHVLILSDIPQGDFQQYESIQNEYRAYPWSRVILIGTHWKSISPMGADAYGDIVEFLNKVEEQSWARSIVLIKGARKSKFEEIVHRLQAKNHLTRLEIDLEAVQHNLNHYRSLLQPQVKMMVMIKADGYGLGAIGIAQSQVFQHVDYIGVAYVDEGVALRQAGISLPIMIMNPEQQSVKALLDFNLEPEVYSLDSFRAMLRQKDLVEPNKVLGIHVKVDTGMRRLGIEPHEWEIVAGMIESRKDIQLLSVLTHLAASEDEQHDDFTREQLRKFEAVVLKAKALNRSVMAHAANSGAIERWPEAQMDMVRLGIGLYGSSSNQESLEHLKTTCVWKTHISQVKQVNAGESVGYGRSEFNTGSIQLAVLPVGYADGLPRILSNGKGSVWIKGKRCPIKGRVCMDMTMVDVTGLNVKEGDEVEIFGKNIHLHEVAAWCGTISYEILTGISNRVKRIFIQQ